MDDEDPWLGPDKLYHFVFCFSLTLLISTLASYSPYPSLRSHSISVGSIMSLLAGAAKEFADHLRIFPSAGASFRDGVADALGVLVASRVLSLWRKFSGRSTGDPEHARRVLPV
ncbi:hypothetical protein Ddye_019939 [Dipteronia dyeriana]|uniref:VanZ-like domain-containing protein n=1 Tax=Dipteronia dyeriana TaxID=168575 RepID=A0AAD9WUW9_9ROSI|nr:hypothetical protein Ddye_019939 [Dipteronia dyeriana]